MSMKHPTLKEQNGGLGRIPLRSSAQQTQRVTVEQGTIQRTRTQQTASPHRSGTTFGIHDESAPYVSNAKEVHTEPPVIPDDDDYEAGYTISRTPSSARRYKPGKKKAHPYALTRITEEVPIRGLTLKGLLLAISLVLAAGILISILVTTYLAPAWRNYSYTQSYGVPPRITKVRFNTGHGTKQHPESQYIGINNGGEIEVLEIPTGTVTSDAAPHMYSIAHLTGAEATTTPITDISFADVNGDGKVDMEVTVNNTLYILYNTGKIFSQQLS